MLQACGRRVTVLMSASNLIDGTPVSGAGGDALASVQAQNGRFRNLTTYIENRSHHCCDTIQTMVPSMNVARVGSVLSIDERHTSLSGAALRSRRRAMQARFTDGDANGQQLPRSSPVSVVARSFSRMVGESCIVVCIHQHNYSI